MIDIDVDYVIPSAEEMCQQSVENLYDMVRSKMEGCARLGRHECSFSRNKVTLPDCIKEELKNKGYTVTISDRETKISWKHMLDRTTLA